MKYTILAALFAALLIAAEPDWGKVIDAQNKPGHHDDDHGHPSNVPEPAGFILVGIGLVGAAAWNSRRK
jgi:hypothetical protein